MGLIEDYKGLTARLKVLQREIPTLQAERERCEQDIQKHKQKLTMLQMESEQRIEDLMRQHLIELTNAEYDELTAKQVTLTDQIKKYTAELNSKKAAVTKDNYAEKLSKSYALLDNLQFVLDSVVIPSEIPTEIRDIVLHTLADTDTHYTQAKLLELINDVKEQQEYWSSIGEVEERAFGDHLIDIISLKSIDSANMTGKAKFYLYLVYLIIMALCFVFVPVIPVLALSLSVIFSYRRYSSENKRLLKLILPYSRLQDGYRFLKTQIDAKVKAYQDKDTQELDSSYAKEIDPLQAAIDDIKYQLQTVETRVRSKMSNQELQKSVEEQFKLRESEVQKAIKACERSIKITDKQLSLNAKEIENKKAEQGEMLPKIKELYLSPRKPGTSPFLIKSFLISIDEEKGKLDNFDYNGRSTFILYKGATSAINKPLITMMLMQFIANMSLASLEIYLTDIQSAGMDYAPFNVCVSIKSNSADVKKLIESLSRELVNRRDTIAAVCDNIEEFNKKRLDSHGLTVPYILVILQDLTIKEMASDDVIQLMVNGPRVGIIPIVFVNHMYINEAQSVSPTDMPSIERFFAAFRYTEDNKDITNTFVFEGATGNLTQSTGLIDAVLRKLRKGT